MKHDFQMWYSKLASHAENCRAANPIPKRNRLSRTQVLQLNIIKGSLRLQLKHLPSIVLPATGLQDSREYCIVFTSNVAGLVAAKEIGQATYLPIFPLYPEELSDFSQLCPDTGHKHHVHIWSHFLKELDSQTAKFAERYPLNDKEKYWLHVEGIMCGPRLGRGTEHLWSWDGMQPKLLKKSFLHWAS